MTMNDVSIEKELTWYLIPTMGFVYVLAAIAWAKGGLEHFPAPIFIMLLPVIFAVITQKFVAKQPVLGPDGLGLRIGNWRQYFRWYVGALAVYWVSIAATIFLFPEIVPPLDSIRMMDELGFESVSPLGQLLIALTINLTLGVLTNMWLFLGEEVGWRGFMMPRLVRLYGENRAVIFGGTIWALWHSPLIIMFGYNYGDHPWIGHLVWIPLCIGFNLYFWRAYRASGSIVLPAMLHGAINQSAAAPTGVLAALSWLVLGSLLGWYLLRTSELQQQRTSPL
jgi:membrane protease YdiL (CAAX protease family)